MCVSENEIWNQNEEKKEKVSHINNAQSRMKLSISSIQTEVEKRKRCALWMMENWIDIFTHTSNFNILPCEYLTEKQNTKFSFSGPQKVNYYKFSYFIFFTFLDTQRD